MTAAVIPLFLAAYPLALPVAAVTAACPREDPHPPHMWTWQEGGVDCPGLSPGDPPPVTLCVPAEAAEQPDREQLRERYAAAIAKADGVIWEHLTERDRVACRREADAVMAVRDAELEQARTELALGILDAHLRGPQ